ncbi:MAG: ferritin-like domain-containing protein, partial [Bdellovibrionota bacterium]
LVRNNSKAVLDCLQDIYEIEISNVNRYLHYSFMILGHNRIPIQKWFRDMSSESMQHAIKIGEEITALGGHPHMQHAQLDESHEHGVDALLEETLETELAALNCYKKLVKLAGDDIALDELAREMVRLETEHIEEVYKMLN